MKKRNNLKYIAGISTVIVMLLVCLVSAALAQTTISVQDASADVGMTTTAQIMVHGVADLGGFGITLSYDPAVANVTGATNNPNLPDDWGISDFTNAANGSVVLASSGLTLPSLNGDVLLTTVTLEAVGSAGQTSPLNIASIGLVNSAGNDISAGVTAVNGTFTITGVTPTPTPTPTPTDKVDLFFLVDGSGSISSSDFQLQKEGLAYAINDSTVVPQTGLISVCIIQFSSTAQVEIALTTITNQGVADSVSAGIMAMTQMGGTTNMSGAFDVAVANFPSDPSGNQVIDLSTDGGPNSATATNLARDAAIAAGFDDVNAIGVDLTPGSAGEIFLQQLVYPQPWTSAPGFYMLATDYQDFKDKIKEKIIQEIAPSAAAVPLLQPPAIIALAAIMGIIAVTFIVRKKTRR